MGTNYYAVRTLNEIEKENAKKMIENDQYDELKEFLDEKTREIHIGKSSGGWKFLFNWNKEKFAPYVSTDVVDGKEQWLYDGFLFLEII